MHTGIIYAAGLNTRLSGYIEERFKGLYKLPNGETLLIRQAKHLISLGADRIVLVIGLEHDELADHFACELGSVDTHVVRNPAYKNKGNMLSFWVARHYCDSDVTFTTSDLFFAAEIPLVLANGERSSILVDGDCNGLLLKDDPVRGKVKNGVITRLHKKLSNDDTDVVCPGFYHYKKVDIQKILKDIETQLMLGRDDQSLYQSLDRVALETYPTPVGCRGAMWVDVDTPADLDALRYHFEN